MAFNWYQSLQYRWKHRGSPEIIELEGTTKDSSWGKRYFESAYDNIEVVRRGVDMMIDSAAEVDISIKDRLKGVVPRTLIGREGTTKPQHIRQATLTTLLRFAPNDFEDINQYRRICYTDLILTGNMYEYFDGAALYAMPAVLMSPVLDASKKIKHYEFGSKKKIFEPHEIIHTRDNSADSTVVGTTRLKSCKDSLRILYKMVKFQDNFFENGAIPGLVLTTPNALGSRIKARMIAEWMKDYSAVKNGRRPMILDADLKPNPISSASFKDLDFENSISKIEKKVLTALGVPPLLIDGGNNANIRPNLQLFFEMTVLPLTAKHISAYEAFFGYDLEPDTINIRALRPEMRDASAFYQGLVNTGIMTINEARTELRMPLSSEAHASKLRIPANIAGSAANPAEGGRPGGEEEDDKKDPDGSEDAKDG